MALEFGQRLHHAESDVAPSGWLRYRKYDGHSAIWLPKTRTDKVSGLWSLGRSSGPKAIDVPKAWLDYLPEDMALHGELWADNDRPQTITRALAKGNGMDVWSKVKFIVFAFPSNVSLDLAKPYEWQKINNMTPWKTMREFAYTHGIMNDRVILPEPTDCDAVTEGWEGIVLQNPMAVYQCGRTRQVLKFKPKYDDEAIVVGYERGKTGARVGTTGAIVVRWSPSEKTKSIHGYTPPSSREITFSVSGLDSSEWDNAERSYPMGSTLSFEFLSISNLGTPMHCSVRRDR